MDTDEHAHKLQPKKMPNSIFFRIPYNENKATAINFPFWRNQNSHLPAVKVTAYFITNTI